MLLAWSCWANFAAASEATKSPVAVNQPGVVAIVGGERIYATEVARWYQRITHGREVAAAMAPVCQAQALGELVNRRLVLAYAERTHSGATPEEIDQAVGELRSSLAQKGKSLEAYLASQKITETDLNRQMRWNIVWQKYLVRYVTEERIAAYFQSHQRQFDGTEISVSHLLLKRLSQKGLNQNSPRPLAGEGLSQSSPRPLAGEGLGVRAGDAASDTDSLVEQARQIREEIGSGKISFDDAVRKHSSGPSASSGGRLGWITWQGPMDEAFTRAAFALHPGEISGPVKTPFGVHLIRCDQIRTGTRPLSEVRGELEKALSRELLDRLARVEAAFTPIEFSAGTPHFRPGTRELVR